MVPIGFSMIAAVVAALSSSTAPSQPQWREGTRSALSLGSSMYGATGLIDIPTAYTTGDKQGRFSAFYGEGLGAPALNYGLFKDVEVGLAYVDRDGADDKLIANAKITIIPANFKFFEVGVGVMDAADAIDQTIYFVASADLVPPNVDVSEAGGLPVAFKVHAGAGTGIFRDKAFFGGELQFGNKFSLLGEWDSADFNVGVRWVPQEQFSIQTGIRRTNLFLSATTNFRF